MMRNEILTHAKAKMEKSLESFRRELVSVRTGKASHSILEGITVDYYGAPTPIHHVANISVPEPRVILISPFEKTSLEKIEKALHKSNLGLNPINDGKVIRLPIPELTEETRKNCIKLVKKMAEEARVAVRNLRREAKDAIKKSEKESSISEDEAFKLQEHAQKLTEESIEKVEQLLQKKEKEIMEV